MEPPIGYWRTLGEQDGENKDSSEFLEIPLQDQECADFNKSLHIQLPNEQHKKILLGFTYLLD